MVLAEWLVKLTELMGAQFTANKVQIEMIKHEL